MTVAGASKAATNSAGAKGGDNGSPPAKADSGTPRPLRSPDARSREAGHATARDMHQASRVRDGALARHPADRPHFLHAPVGARVSEDRRPDRERVGHLSRRVRRSRRVAGDEAARGFAFGHRGRRGDDVAEPIGNEPHQRALHAEARPRLRGGRRPRQGGARARQAARHDRRADHRQGRGGLATRDLHRGAGRIADAARGVRLRQALRAAAALRAAGRRGRPDLRRAAGLDADQPRPHAARRLQAHRAGRRGRDPPAERGDSGGAHRVVDAGVHGRRGDRRQAAGAIQQHHRRQRRQLSGAHQGRGRGRDRRRSTSARSRATTASPRSTSA